MACPPVLGQLDEGIFVCVRVRPVGEWAVCH